MKFDIAEHYSLGFQEPASPIAEEIITFHHYVMIYLTFIIVGVVWIMFRIMTTHASSVRAISHKYLIHGTVLEFVWTVSPALVLVAIAFPSFKLIYLIDEVVDPAVTVKVVGHQWYWSYEYSDYQDIDNGAVAYDSYLVPTEDLELGDFRLLEVDNALVVPAETHVRVIVTADDVIHCWTVPSLGVKVDAIPGRLNQTAFLATREGTFYGQCSEICGVNHAFMPIVIEAVSLEKYIAHIDSLIESQ